MTSVSMSHFTLNAPPPPVSAAAVGRIASENLWIKPVSLPYEKILENLEKIGDHWHERPEHKNGRRAKTKKRLESRKTHTWMFMRGDKEIGFCVAVKQGFDDSLADRYNVAAKGTEIYKIGLFPEYQHEGLGHCFLPVIQIALLDGQKAVPAENIAKVIPSERIYLNTRDSNSTDSRNFYGMHGWELRGEEVFEDSVLPQVSGLSHILVPKDQANVQKVRSPRKRSSSQRRPLNPVANFSS